jgi:hypothetical protein
MKSVFFIFKAILYEGHIINNVSAVVIDVDDLAVKIVPVLKCSCMVDSV